LPAHSHHIPAIVGLPARQAGQAGAVMALSERLFAAGLEQLSGNVVQLQADAKGRLDTLEQRLVGAEKTTRFNTDALDHALEKIDSNANQRAIDQVEAQRRATQADQRFNRLEDSLARLEMCLPGVDLSPRLETIEFVVAPPGE
jgi:hypothetical protein